PDIPLSSYTNALRQTGVSFEVWNRHLRGSPGLSVLRAYRAVIWRINDNGLLSFSPPPEYTLSSTEQATITSYLNGGGAFLMASMEILTRGISPAFQANVLHVLTNAVDVMVPGIDGVESDPVTAGISTALDYSGYPNEPDLGLDPDISDTIVSTADAVP